MLHEINQEVKLLRRQVQHLSLALGDPSIKIDLQVSGAQAPELHRRFAGELLDSPQDGLYPRRELDDAEGLGHIVVGPRLESQHSIEFACSRGEHQDRGVRSARAYAAADFKPIDLRKTKIQDKQTPCRSVQRSRKAAASVVARVDLAAEIFQVQCHQPCDVGLILDDQHPA